MPEQDMEVNPAEQKHGERRGLAVGLVSLFFILLQSSLYRIFRNQRFAFVDRRRRACRGSYGTQFPRFAA